MTMECCDVQPLIVGITGGIGAGKSVVSRILRLKGYRVYDCDTEARRLMEHDLKVREGIIEILGAEAYGKATVALSGGDALTTSEEVSAETADAVWSLNRKYVASKIFNDSCLRDAVNAVVHKAVAEDFLSYARKTSGIVFCETAILATSHMDTICDSIWVVTAPEDERIDRVKRRNSLPEKEIRLRMATQREELEQLPKEKVVEIGNGDSDMLLPQIDKLIGKTNKEEICLEKF